jgi:hypothetical protein
MKRNFGNDVAWRAMKTQRSSDRARRNRCKLDQGQFVFLQDWTIGGVLVTLSKHC